MRANGAVIYEGPSMLDGSPIVAIVTGLAHASANAKTGAMLQTWIMRADVPPVDALKSGADASVCGECPQRPALGGACYVLVHNAPRSVWEAWKRGVYASGEPELLGCGRAVRLGSYGDPAAVPVRVWRDLVSQASLHTGYTHQWRNLCAIDLQALCMASVDSPEEREEAQALGWRTFRVAPAGNGERARGEARCPASAEAGHRVSCETCPIRCAGTALAMPSVVIQAHGSKARKAPVKG
jgi:hypothetical protein